MNETYATNAANAGSLNAARELTLTESISNQLSGIIGTLSDTVDRLSVTRDRTFGSAPQDPNNAKASVQPVPNGAANEIGDKLGFARALASQAQDIAAELQRQL
jgi:hypothetical protein